MIFGVYFSLRRIFRESLTARWAECLVRSGLELGPLWDGGVSFVLRAKSHVQRFGEFLGVARFTRALKIVVSSSLSPFISVKNLRE